MEKKAENLFSDRNAGLVKKEGLGIFKHLKAIEQAKVGNEVTNFNRDRKMKKYLDLTDINEALSKSGFKSVSTSIEDSKTLNITAAVSGRGIILEVGLGCGMISEVDMDGREKRQPIIFIADILIDTIGVNPKSFMDNIRHPRYEEERSSMPTTTYYRHKELPQGENEILYF